MSKAIPDVGQLAGMCYWDGSNWQPLDSSTWAGLLTELVKKVDTEDLNITASKELIVLLSALVGAVETSLVAFSGGILKTALGYAALQVDERHGALADSATWTEVMNEDGSGVLEALDIAGTYNLSEVHVELDGQELLMPLVAGTASRVFRHLNVHDLGGESYWWRESRWDSGNSLYAGHLKRAVKFNSNLTIKIRQESGSSQDLSVVALWRLIG